MKNTLRGLLLFVMMLAVCSSIHAQARVVSGNLIDLGLNNVTSGNTYVSFVLQGYGSNIPKIVGSSVIVSPTSPPFKPDGSGNISGNITRNDFITPTSTFYQVCVFNKGTQFRCNNYLINTSTFNLNTAIPITVNPTPPFPPQAVLKNPTATQNVIQPGGTQLQVGGHQVCVAGVSISGCAGGAGNPCTVTANSIQYNNAGSFGCVTPLTFSTVTNTITNSGFTYLGDPQSSFNSVIQNYFGTPDRTAVIGASFGTTTSGFNTGIGGMAQATNAAVSAVGVYGASYRNIVGTGSYSVALEGDALFNIPVSATEPKAQAAIYGFAQNFGLGTMTTLDPFYSQIVNNTGAIITNAYAYDGEIDNTGTIGTAAFYHVPSIAGIGGTRNAGLLIDNQGSGANDYAIYSLGGKIHSEDFTGSLGLCTDSLKNITTSGCATGGNVTASGSPVSGNIAKFTSGTNIAPATGTDVIALWSGSCTSSTFLRADGSCQTPSGAGTVTHTAGALTANQLVFGNGTADIKVGNLSGDVLTAGSGVTALANIPTRTPMQGPLDSIPTTFLLLPTVGHSAEWFDSGTGVWSAEGHAGVISITAVPSTCGAHNFFNSLSTGGAFNCAQPAFTDISGAATYVQLPLPSAIGDVICSTTGPVYAECTPGRKTVNETGSGTILTFAQSDNNKLYTQANGSASAYTLPIVSSLSDGWSAAQMNMGAGTITTSITTSTATVCGASSCASAQTSFTVTTGQFALIYSNSTGYFVKIF